MQALCAVQIVHPSGSAGTSQKKKSQEAHFVTLTFFYVEKFVSNQFYETGAQENGQ